MAYGRSRSPSPRRGRGRSDSRSPDFRRDRRRSPEYSYDKDSRRDGPRGRYSPDGRGRGPPGPPPLPREWSRRPYEGRGREDTRGHHHHQNNHPGGWGGGQGGRGPGGGWIGGDARSYGTRLEPHLASADADLEAGIAENDFTEFRRLKRIELAKDNRYCIWDNTPSPSRSPSPSPSPELQEGKGGLAPEEEGGGAEDAAAVEGIAAPDAATDAELKATSDAEEEGDNDFDKEESAMLKRYLDEMRVAAEKAEAAAAAAAEENAFVGPELPSQAKAAPNSYGKALLPGEGEAMAAFVQSGKRIPRRGEVGLTADEIQNFEDLGYIMSGSRHSRMNAIRIRKENQIYTAEEKAALAQLNFEEKAKKEQRVLNDMRKLVEQAVQGEAGGGEGGSL